MDSLFRAARLGSDGAHRAYALIQFLDPALRREDWTAFLAAAGADSQVMTLEDARGYAHAVFTHKVEHDLRHGRVLRLNALACTGLPSKVLHQAIFDAADRIAREQRCGGVIFEVAEAPAAGGFEAASPGLEAALRARCERVSASYYRALPRNDG